jgi:hypothetical protein
MTYRYNITVTRTTRGISIYAVNAHNKEEAKMKFSRMDDYTRDHCLVDYREEDEDDYDIKNA